MFDVNKVGYDHLDEAIEVAIAVKADVTERGVTVFSYNRWNDSLGKSETSFIVHDPIETAKQIMSNGQTLFNGQTVLYEADRLREVAAVRGVVTFEEFAKFHRRLIPLLAELGISLDDTDDARKARLESMAEG